MDIEASASIAFAKSAKRLIEAAAPFVLLAACWQVGSLFFPKYLFPSLVDVSKRCVDILFSWSQFSDVLAISGEPGSVVKPGTAKVTAEIVGEGRGDKVLVFHLKRKKQYKKLQGHRQNFTEVRIKAIEADGVTYTAAS